MAAPALAASIAWVAIWSGVIGSASDMVGVWIEPVIAQLMTSLFAMDHFLPLSPAGGGSAPATSVRRHLRQGRPFVQAEKPASPGGRPASPTDASARSASPGSRARIGGPTAAIIPPP